MVSKQILRWYALNVYHNFYYRKDGFYMVPKRVYAEIDLGNLVFNINQIKNKTKTDVMAVIKTDAYGHSAVQCAHALNENGIYNFAVATAQEALELRNNGIAGRILILGYVFPENYKKLIENNICLTVFDLQTACELNEEAKKLNSTAVIHIKVDTGMGRIGFLPNEKSVSEIVEISLLNNIFIEGAFTHFSCADMTDKTFSLKQKQLFDDFIKSLENRGVVIPVKHTSNSAAIMDFNDGYYDFVRSGIISYGLYPSDEVNFDALELRPVMSLISHVVFVKEVEKDFPVSYGATFVTNRKTKVATIPVGYGDGYPRALSNVGMVLINGYFAPIIGRVCMDQFMVDVTDIPSVKRGDRVTLVGQDGKSKISVEDLSKLCGRFNYEFVCDINKRVDRIFKK